MPSGPFDADLDLEARHALGERLRLLLEEDALDVRAMAAGLGVEPEVVVVALRELRLNGGGRLRTAVALGRVTWRCEPLGEVAPAVATRHGRTAAARAEPAVRAPRAPDARRASASAAEPPVGGARSEASPVGGVPGRRRPRAGAGAPP